MDSATRQMLKRIDDRTRDIKEFILSEEGTGLMAALADILANLQGQTTLIEGVGTLLTNLKEEIKKLQLNQNDQDKIDEVFAVAEANRARLAADLLANTPEAVPAP